MIEEEGPETVAAVFAEPVQNSRGALVPPEGYWRELRAICDRYGILLVSDEVICAYGRLGEWFGSAKYGVVPDLLTFAKGATSGYAPLGGVLIREELAAALLASPQAGTFTHGATWGGHPVSTAVAVANISAMRDEHVLDNVRTLEPHFQQGLDQIVQAHASVLRVARHRILLRPRVHRRPAHRPRADQPAAGRAGARGDAAGHEQGQPDHATR